MTGRAFAVAGGKGGVGKTTTVVNLGVMLRVAGHRVAVVDADLGMANLATVLGVDHTPTLHDVLAGEATVDEALVEEPEGFAVLPGIRDLSGFAAADPDGLESVIDTLARDFDVVLIDTGAGLSHEVVLPFGMTDGVLLVTTPDRPAVGDAEKTAELAALAGGTIVGVVVTRARGDLDADMIADRLDAPVLAVIPEDEAVPASIDAGKPLITLGPDSEAAVAYRSLVPAFLERVDAAATAETDADEIRATPNDQPDSTETDVEAAESATGSGAQPDRPEGPANGGETDQHDPDSAAAPLDTEPIDADGSGPIEQAGEPAQDDANRPDTAATETSSIDAIEDAEAAGELPVDERDQADPNEATSPGDAGGQADDSPFDADAVALGEETADVLADAIAEATELADAQSVEADHDATDTGAADVDPAREPVEESTTDADDAEGDTEDDRTEIDEAADVGSAPITDEPSTSIDDIVDAEATSDAIEERPGGIAPESGSDPEWDGESPGTDTVAGAADPEADRDDDATELIAGQAEPGESEDAYPSAGNDDGAGVPSDGDPDTADIETEAAAAADVETETDDEGEEPDDVAIPAEDAAAEDGISIPEAREDPVDEPADDQETEEPKRGLLSRILHPFG